MEEEVVTIPLSATHEEATRILVSHKISGAPVTDEAYDLVGFVSEKDLFRVLYPTYSEFREYPTALLDYERLERKLLAVRARPVAAFMVNEVVTIAPDADVLRAGAIMLAQGIHRLPVVEYGELVGMVTRDQVFRVILKDHYLEF